MLLIVIDREKQTEETEPEREGGSSGLKIDIKRERKKRPKEFEKRTYKPGSRGLSGRCCFKRHYARERQREPEKGRESE